jgi:type III secretory pathway component EscS
VKTYLNKLMTLISREPVLTANLVKGVLIIIVQGCTKIGIDLPMDARITISSIIFVAISAYTRQTVVPAGDVATALDMPSGSTPEQLKAEIAKQN